MNIRPATHDDVEFLQKMLYEAARWNPDWPRESLEEVLADPMTTRYHEGWGRPGDAGVIAELDDVPVAAAWYRLFTADAPGYGFVDRRSPTRPRGRATSPPQGHRRHAAAGVDGAGARGGVPGALALRRRAQPLADDVPAGRVRARGRGRRWAAEGRHGTRGCARRDAAVGSTCRRATRRTGRPGRPSRVRRSRRPSSRARGRRQRAPPKHPEGKPFSSP